MTGWKPIPRRVATLSSPMSVSQSPWFTHRPAGYGQRSVAAVRDPSLGGIPDDFLICPYGDVT